MDEGYYRAVATTPDPLEPDDRDNPFGEAWNEACDETELITNEDWPDKHSLDDEEEDSEHTDDLSSPEELNREDFIVADMELPPMQANGINSVPGNNNSTNGTCGKLGEGLHCNNPVCLERQEDIVTVWVSDATDSAAVSGYCAWWRKLRCGYWVAAATCVLLAGVVTTLWVWTSHGRQQGALDDASTATAVLVGPALTLLGVIGVFVACVVYEVRERKRYDPLQEDAPPTEEFL